MRRANKRVGTYDANDCLTSYICSGKNLYHKIFEISCNYREKGGGAFVLILGLCGQNCHCSAQRAAKVQPLPRPSPSETHRPHLLPKSACKEQLRADNQKQFHSEGTAAIRRTSKPHNTNTQQHTPNAAYCHSCLTITKQRADPSVSRVCRPFWLDTMAPAVLRLGWGSWSQPAWMS